MTTARAAAVECGLRCLEQRIRGAHQLKLSEIHRIYTGEFGLGAEGRRLLAQAHEQASAAADRRPA